MYIGLLFAQRTIGSDSTMMILTPAVFTDEVMKLFGLASKTVKQAPMVIENMSALVEEVSQERDYLSCAVRFSLLLLRLVTYLF